MQAAPQGSAATTKVPAVRALVFDVFGTVVDWRSSIIREGEMLTASHGIKADWPAFADAWRAGYKPAMDRVRKGALSWTNIDVLHREILDSLLPAFGLQALSPAELEHLNRVWHRLMPWPDTVSGLNRLKSRYLISTLSNGNVALLVNMAKNAGLPWDCVMSAELFAHYKPDPEVYEGAARMLDLPREQVMMVAAHTNDLRAARAAGLATAYVHRPLEHGPGSKPEQVAQGDFDVVASDFLDLARRIGA
jgi:2-haloacid dehalogenase